MSARLLKEENPVAQGENGVRIRPDEQLEARVRMIVREELRDFLIAQRRAARYVDAVICEKLGK